MFTFLIEASLVLAGSSAAAAPEHRFSRDGVSYLYSIADRGGARIINGRVVGGQSFHFTVRHGWVTGNVGMSSVSFRVPALQSGAVEVTSR